MKVCLVPNWRRAWRWLSMNIPATNFAFLGTWATLPPKFQDALPIEWVLGIAAALILMGMFGRLIEQEGGDATNQ